MSKNNNLSKSIDMLDILSIISFLAQMKNMNDDEQQAIYDNKIIKAISAEINQMHEENKKIIEKLDEIEKDDRYVKEYLHDIFILLNRRL